jgi:Arc/MetJ-type ribon-helix-helix transcriptional regulator
MILNGGRWMTVPSTLISIRITEEELALLDSRIGLDGARNRSDVIRAAIREFLTGQPLLPEMDLIKIPVGRSMKQRLGQLYELQGITPEQAAQQGLQNYVIHLIKEEAGLNDTLDSAVAAAREQTIKSREFHQ